MRLSGLLLVWLAAAWPQAAWSAPAADEPSVRTGTTEVRDTDAPGATVESRHEAPGDAPRTTAGSLRLPGVPAGYNTYDGGWIKFVYHPSIRERVQPLIADAAATRTALTEWVGQPVLSEVRVVVARTPGEMAMLAPANAPFPEWAAGVAYPEVHLVLLTVLPVHPTSQHDLAEVFRHELAHVALEDAVNGRPIPRWFNEGFAVMASGETAFNRMTTLWSATVSDHLISLSELERSFPAKEWEADVAYAEAADVVRFLVRREEKHRFRGLGLAPARRRDNGQRALQLLRRANGDSRKRVARRRRQALHVLAGAVLGQRDLGWHAGPVRRRLAQEAPARPPRHSRAGSAKKRLKTKCAVGSPCVPTPAPPHRACTSS